MDLKTILVLCGRRSKLVALSFLDQFLPVRRESAVDYPFPQFSDHPLTVYTDVDALLVELELNAKAEYTLYWDGVGLKNQEQRQAFLYFTTDGSMFACYTFYDAEPVTLLQRIAACTQSQYGCLIGDHFPPESAQEFIDICKHAEATRIIAGQLIIGTEE
jgi:hypothetical protein